MKKIKKTFLIFALAVSALIPCHAVKRPTIVKGNSKITEKKVGNSKKSVKHHGSVETKMAEKHPKAKKKESKNNKKPSITVKWMDKNPCWTDEPRTIKPGGIMVHSTASPGMMALDWYEKWNKSLEEGGKEVAVHAFLDDKCIMQYLPWTKRAWHCGKGENGSGNDTHISIEMCEPSSIIYNSNRSEIVSYDPKDPENKKYFNSALKNMVDLCAYLCNEFKIKPKNIICHHEGHELGIASDHADVLHWWPLHGVTMDMFRQMVEDTIQGKPVKYDF